MSTRTSRSSSSAVLSTRERSSFSPQLMKMPGHVADGENLLHRREPDDRFLATGPAKLALDFSCKQSTGDVDGQTDRPLFPSTPQPGFSSGLVVVQRPNSGH